MVRRIILILALAAFAAGPLAAQSEAEQKQKSLDLTEKAKAQFKVKNYDGAVKFLVQAYDAYPFPTLLMNIAKAYRLSGDAKNALIYYKRFLALNPEAKLEKLAMKQVKLLEEKLKVSVTFKVDPKGAQIYLDEKFQGSAPLPPVKLMPGVVEVAVEHPEYIAMKKKIEVKPDKNNVINIVLVKRHKAVKTKPGKRLWTWVAGGAGVAMIGAGVYFQLKAGTEYDSLKGDVGNPAVLNADQIGHSDALSRKDTVDSYDNLSYLFYGLGGAGLITGAVLWFVEGKPKAVPSAYYDGDSMYFTLTSTF